MNMMKMNTLTKMSIMMTTSTLMTMSILMSTMMMTSILMLNMMMTSTLMLNMMMMSIILMNLMMMMMSTMMVEVMEEIVMEVTGATEDIGMEITEEDTEAMEVRTIGKRCAAYKRYNHFSNFIYIEHVHVFIYHNMHK